MKKVFVFGSNTTGRHGKGAALEAVKNWGAVYGCGEGMQLGIPVLGRSYAIPTKKGSAEKGTPLETLPLDAIKLNVKRFIEYAKEHDRYYYLVTRIGCGLAMYEPEQIAPMFKSAKSLEHVYFPYDFLSELDLDTGRMSFDSSDRMSVQFRGSMW